MQAVLELLRQLIIDNISSGIRQYGEWGGYFTVFVLMVLESACVPIPSEVTMPFAGFLVWRGDLSSFWVAALAGTLGNVVGSIIAYIAGDKGGRPFILRYGKYLLIHPKKLETADKFFERYGHEAVFISRLLPVVRTFISLPAGVAEMNFWKFLFYTFAGVLPWCIGLTYSGIFLGNNWRRILAVFHQLDYAVIGGILLIIVFYIWRWYVKRQKAEYRRQTKSSR